MRCTAEGNACSWSSDREQCERLDANDLKNQSQCPTTDPQTETQDDPQTETQNDPQTETKKDNNLESWVIPVIVLGSIVFIVVLGIGVRAIGMRHRESESYNYVITTEYFNQKLLPY